ncbi:hypothetical protein HHK36_030589 [Tetracentron sinense]|uniref:Uncharacterized protein n=1 Tax=Tetracentron sinense TaxID=13715 RepID=A0A835CYV5_TETSI|nr:hypothetical protein HHK36_030589 [Tetracentron sinense]
MAFASRLLSRSKQLYAGQIILQQEHAVTVRFFGKEAAPTALKGDESQNGAPSMYEARSTYSSALLSSVVESTSAKELEHNIDGMTNKLLLYYISLLTTAHAFVPKEMLKNIFFEVKKKFETSMGILRKEKITIDPDDPATVAKYAKVMKLVREKADLFSESQRIQYTIQTRTQGIQDARSYLLTLKEIRIKRGLTDDLGAEAMMMDALEKIEKELNKTLMRNDKKGMALLMAEFDKINKK